MSVRAGPTVELLQARAMEKEENRIKGIQARNQERLQRFLNARERTIGLNVQALDAQVEEKRRLKELEKEAAKREAARTAEIARLLEVQEQEERVARRAVIESFKPEWELQKLTLREKQKKTVDFGEAREKCGLASLQQLSGEDDHAYQRRKMQMQQMKNWTNQQIEEKRYRALVESAEEQRYADFLRRMTELAAQQEAAESNWAKTYKKQVQEENAAKAHEQQLKKQEALIKTLEEEKHVLERLNQDPMLNEANDYFDEENGKIRRDRFRGYTTAQRNQIISENETLIQKRAELKEMEKKNDLAWANQQEKFRQLMEEQEWYTKMQRKALALDQQQTLLQQKEAHLRSSKNSKADAFGSVGEGFYKGFGTSCR